MSPPHWGELKQDRLPTKSLQNRSVMEVESLTVSVEGLNVNAVVKTLRRTRGVEGVDVDLGESIATVTFDETEVDSSTVRTLVERTHHPSN